MTEYTVTFEFSAPDSVSVSSWGSTTENMQKAAQWAEKRRTELLIGVIPWPSKERVRKRCPETQDMFA